MTLPAGVRQVTTRFLDLIDASAPGLVEGLYLRGSLGFGEYFEGQSDIDFTAVLAARPDASSARRARRGSRGSIRGAPEPAF